MITLQQVELGVLGPLRVRQYGLPVAIPGAKPRAILTMLGLHGGSVVAADALVELVWGDEPPRTAAKALQTHISTLRRALGDGCVVTEGSGWTLSTAEIDATRYVTAAGQGRHAFAIGDVSQAVAHFDEALALWRGGPDLPDGRRGVSERTRWLEGHAALVEDRADAVLATGRAAEVVGELEASIADAPLRERRWGQLMLALYRAGRQGEALGAYRRARSLLADELGVDPGPELRRLEAAIVAQDPALELPVPQQLSTVTRAVTFLLTDIEGSTAAWESDAEAMAQALARHDEIVEQVVTFRGGRLIKTRGEGDATFSVFDRPSAAAAAAIDMQEAIAGEPWPLVQPMRIRVALHTGEVEFRDGDYFGRAVNRAARLRSLASGGQILCSGATAELVVDTLSDDVVLADLGLRQLKNLTRPEHVFELRLENADDVRAPAEDVPLQRPDLPAVLSGCGPFVGRRPELERLLTAWRTMLTAGADAVLISGEPGVGKTRLAGEWSRQAYEQGAVVLYGRCDEDLGAPYQPFAEALRALVPCVGTSRLRGLRGVEALLSLVPGLTEVLPDLTPPPRADPDTERYALFDAVVALLGIATASAPVVLVLDDLHWATKPTLLLLRHLLRFGEHARVQIVGTYRSTDLDRSHPLAAILADLHRDGSADRLALGGLDADDVTTYVAEAGYDDEELARALASVTGGNPFFLIEALRHVDESGGRWDQSTLPQGVREAVSRRLSRLPVATNKALAAAAVVGSRFPLALVETVVGGDLVDAFEEASQAGIVIEEPGGSYRFNHAIVRQSLLAELASVRRMRLHQKIATTLESQPRADDELLAELAHHYFECAWAGNAVKAVEYCRRAADQAMTRLAYEGAADLYDKALHALEEIDDELPDRDVQQAELLVARCEALLAAGDVVTAADAVDQLRSAAGDSGRLAAWGTCFDGQLSMLTDPEHLDEIECAVSAAAAELAALDDAAGEAMAHTVRAGCLGRLGRIGDCETALDQALTAARRAREHRRVNAVLAQAPLAALWGPNPVPRAGGRCLDVVRLLRITTGSPVVEATSTRCQGVLDAFRGRAAAGRALLDSARRTLTELGMRHALLEVDQFAGILELVADEPDAAEPHLRRAYNGFRRMGLEADTAETAALLARACLAQGSYGEADELCTESEHLAGHALKASISWRVVRAQLLARNGVHDEARRVAREAVTLAGGTDALVDHGDTYLALATVLSAAGDVAGARAAAEQALGLYERKGAAALADKARALLGAGLRAAAVPEAPVVELDNVCMRRCMQFAAAAEREAWDEVEQLCAETVDLESRRKIVGFTRASLAARAFARETSRYSELGVVRHHPVCLAVRGERLALFRLALGTDDVTPGAPQDEMLQVVGLDREGRIAFQVSFDPDDFDDAMAELDAMAARFGGSPPSAPGSPLENAASRLALRFTSCFAERRWADIASMWSDGIWFEDRRRGLRRNVINDSATGITELQGMADLGVTTITSRVIATRGERLALFRTRYSGRDQRPEAFHTEVLQITELGADGRVVAAIAFDTDDADAAFAELNARYLLGEAAPYAEVWQRIMDGAVTLNRHQPGAMDHEVDVFVDHRRIPFAPADIGPATDKLWELVPDATYRAAAVYALDAHGAVINLVLDGTGPHGNEMHWSAIDVITFASGRGRLEVFDEADLEVALARFEELGRAMPKLENAASELTQRFWAYYDASDWESMRDSLIDDIAIIDRRSVVGFGLQRGRDSAIEIMRAAPEVGVPEITQTNIATRGELLVLVRTRFTARDQQPDAFFTEILYVIEITGDRRFATFALFDTDDLDAAFEELDARYLAGEASPCRDTWRVIAESYASVRRGELPATTSDWVNVDHRRAAVAVAPGDLTAYLRATWELNQDVRPCVEVVRRLTNRGAVVGYVAHGTSADGFEAEWRQLSLSLVDGEMISRTELFDEDDLDTALARFDELSIPAPQLGNLAGRVTERTFSTAAVIATRGQRLVLTRGGAGNDEGAAPFQTEVLTIGEIDADGRISAAITFDSDDLEAAFEELDARYLAGEATEYARTWSVLAAGYAALNRHEIPPTTRDWVNVDHRRGGSAFASGHMATYIRASWDDSPTNRIHVETVHRLNHVGAVVTSATCGTSVEGFYAEWREVGVVTVDGDMISRTELFDEDDLGVALARFDELVLQTPQLANLASHAAERFLACFAARDWGAMARVLADDTSMVDHRPLVGAGVRHGAEVLANWQATADIGVKAVSLNVIATRGDRLALCRCRFSGRDQRPEAYHTDALAVVEINADEQVLAHVAFEVDDVEAAFEELDARYLAGEAAAYADMWSIVTRNYAAFNRGEVPPSVQDWVTTDHRRGGASFGPGSFTEYIRSTWDVAPDISVRIERVHRLDALGAAITQVSRGSTSHAFEVEWREICLFTLDGEVLSKHELFDESDLDAALARFDELTRDVLRGPENTATRVTRRFNAYFAAPDWSAMAEMVADDMSNDDRRPLVGAGFRSGRDAEIDNVRVLIELGVTTAEWFVIATRGDRLALARVRLSGQGAEAFHTEVLSIIEIDADSRIAARVWFDLDDVASAFAELDGRYLAGEAADHADVWSCITRNYAAFNRGEMPATTHDWTTIDHRGGASFEPGSLADYIRSTWDVTPDITTHIETVHRLGALGAVITEVSRGTSPEHFEVEWREVCLFTFDRDLLSSCELFDESDLDAALARFDELTHSAARLHNTATRAYDRVEELFLARDWNAVAEALSPDVHYDDRRPVIGAGLRRGREAWVTDMQVATAAFGSMSITSAYLGTRGDRLALRRCRYRGRDHSPDAFYNEVLYVIEVGTDQRITALVTFAPDDPDAAFVELDNRYAAGGAAPCVKTWRLVTECYAALNRHQLPPTTPDFVDVDHRRVTPMASGSLIDFVRAAWNQIPDISFCIEAVHRLSSLGAVVTYVLRGASQGGFEAEWRDIHLMTVDGDQFNRTEFFDEADIDAALRRFDELDRAALRGPENTATRVYERFNAYLASPDWAAMAAMIADGMCNDDRRPLVGAGFRSGRDAELANVRVIIDLGVTNAEWFGIATRGERLALGRVRVSEGGPDAFHTDVLGIVEIDADSRIVARVWFALDDVASAFAELDARYLAGEAAACAQTWSVIARTYAMFNRHELPATDWVTIDHRRGTPFSPRDMITGIRQLWYLTPDFTMHVAAVHRLDACVAVVTHSSSGTSREGFDAEWRMIQLLMVDGDRVTRCELFDETDLDAALARFDELKRSPMQANAAALAYKRFQAIFGARDWDAVAEVVSEDTCTDDRRRVVNAGVRRGRDGEIANMRAVADMGIASWTSEAIATRGDRLVLSRTRYSADDQRSQGYDIEVLDVLEIDADERIAVLVTFDLDDFDAAFAELDNRYATGEAAAHARTWAVVTGAYAALNRHEFAPTTPDWEDVDHRKVAREPGELKASMRAMWDLVPNVTIHVESVHGLNDFGAVVTDVAQGTSKEGFYAEWREVAVIMVDGDLISRCEAWYEADLDAALARFAELSHQRPPLGNAASRAYGQLWSHIGSRDFDAVAELLVDDVLTVDRRRVVNSGVQRGRDAEVANLRSLAEVGANATATVVATRGERLALHRVRVAQSDLRYGEFEAEMVVIVETDADGRIAGAFLFDLDDFDAAIAELEARYLAGEVAAHARTWSAIARVYAAFNRREFPPTTKDFVGIDHRSVVSVDTGDMQDSVRAVLDQMPDLSILVESVHRLTDLGAVVTHAARGASQEGFDAEWRMVFVYTVDGDLIDRFEFFDEADLGAALARFDELGLQPG